MAVSNKSSVENLSKLQSDVNKYFEKQLDSLGLSMSALRRQTEDALRRNLIVINHAIENHESFGKFGVSMTAESNAIIVSAKRDSLFEVGILPLLLERKQLILKRLEEFDKKRNISSDNSQTIKSNIQTELTKIAQREINLRLWAVIGLMIVLWAIMFFLIQRFGWNLLEPWTYLIGIGLAIVGYAYFAVQQREFSPYAIYQNALESRKKQLFQIFGVEE